MSELPRFPHDPIPPRPREGRSLLQAARDAIAIISGTERGSVDEAVRFIEALARYADEVSDD